MPLIFQHIGSIIFIQCGNDHIIQWICFCHSARQHIQKYRQIAPLIEEIQCQGYQTHLADPSHRYNLTWLKQHWRTGSLILVNHQISSHILGFIQCRCRLIKQNLRARFLSQRHSAGKCQWQCILMNHAGKPLTYTVQDFLNLSQLLFLCPDQKLICAGANPNCLLTLEFFPEELCQAFHQHISKNQSKPLIHSCEMIHVQQDHPSFRHVSATVLQLFHSLLKLIKPGHRINPFFSLILQLTDLSRMNITDISHNFRAYIITVENIFSIQKCPLIVLFSWKLYPEFYLKLFRTVPA